MMFIPWFEVPNIVDGGTTYVPALAVTGVHDDGSKRELVVPGFPKPVKTSLSVDEIFQRMSDAIEGAYSAEMEALRASVGEPGSWPKADEVSKRDTEGAGRPTESLPSWATPGSPDYTGSLGPENIRGLGGSH